MQPYNYRYYLLLSLYSKIFMLQNVCKQDNFFTFHCYSKNPQKGNVCLYWHTTSDKHEGVEFQRKYC